MRPENVPPVARSYFRLPTASLESCLAGGAFSTGRDRDLLRIMYDWRNRAAEFNDKLRATEHLALVQGTPTATANLHKAVTESATTLGVRQALATLLEHLMQHYSSQSGISRDTTLFPR